MEAVCELYRSYANDKFVDHLHRVLFARKAPDISEISRLIKQKVLSATIVADAGEIVE